MQLRPVLPPGGDVVRRDAHTLVVGGRPGVLVADRPGLVPLLRLLDGRGLEDVARLAAERVPEVGGDVVELVHELVARGALLPGPPPPPPRLTVRVQAWGGSAHRPPGLRGARGARPAPAPGRRAARARRCR